VVSINALRLGRAPASRKQAIGYSPSRPEIEEAGEILFDGDGHLMTIAPTGSGKGVSCLIPALLTYPGPVVVIDIKGEAARITRHYRETVLGQRIVLIDPWNLVEPTTHAINPLDWIDFGRQDYFESAQALAQLLLPADGGDIRDPHWNQRARQILAGILMLVAAHYPDRHRHLGSVGRFLAKGPSDMGKLIVAMERSPIAEIAQTPGQILAAPDRERGSILSTATRAVIPWVSKFLEPAMTRSDITAADLAEGAEVSLYLVIPPSNLASHAQLLTVWLGLILNALSSRIPRPGLPQTLILIDEAAQLGYLHQLVTTYSLLRGYGVRAWSFWQSPGQLRSVYPKEGQNMVDQSQVIQAFGISNGRMADQMAELLGVVDGPSLLTMPADQCVVQSTMFADRHPRFLIRPNYLTDPVLRARARLDEPAVTEAA